MDFSFKEIALILSKWQYQTFFDIMEEFTRYFKAKEHSAYRPVVTVKGKYAVDLFLISHFLKSDSIF